MNIGTQNLVPFGHFRDEETEVQRRDDFPRSHSQLWSRALFHHLCCKVTVPLPLCHWHQWQRFYVIPTLHLQWNTPLEMPKLPTPLETFQMMKWSTPASTHGISESISLLALPGSSLISSTPTCVWCWKPCLLHGIPDPWEMRLWWLNTRHSNFHR